jgi:methionine-gamma-lyase
MSEHKDHSSEVRAPTAVLTKGFDPSLSVGSARPAVFRSSTYVFSSPEAAERAFNVVSGRQQAKPGEQIELIYSRFNHPNAEILEDQMAPLETNAKAAAVFNSGMAAIMTTLMVFLKPGDQMIYTIPLYGGTQYLIHDFLEPLGIQGIPVHAGDGAGLDKAIHENKNVKVIFIETPANPTLIMTDIQRACKTALEISEAPLVIVDNTFMGPVFQHPIKLGAPLVVYSATKYLSGFSDMIAGAVLSNNVDFIKKIRGKRGLFGNILPPDECWLLDGRLPTVSLRMNRQSKNAQRIAERLASHPKVKSVFYPTLFKDADQVRIYKNQCDHPGGLFSLDLKGGKKAAFDFLRNLHIGRNAVSLGGVETLVCHPKTTTHSGLSSAEMEQAGITDGLVRISVGVEDWRDLLSDFEQTLGAIG